MIDLLFPAAIAAPVVRTVYSPPPVPIIAPHEISQPGPRQQSVVVLTPTDARCADGALDISQIEKPGVQLVWPPLSVSEKVRTLSFRIDERGRALGIATNPTAFGLFDLAPSLAASQFQSGKPRTGCSISYVPSITSIADAPLDDLISYSVLARQRPPKELLDRITPAGSTCARQRPAVLLRAYPDFETVPAAPGRTDWTMTRFDIDADGKPVAINIYASSSNKVLDKASAEAVAKSRYAKGERTGCIYNYWRRAEKVEAPQSPDIDTYRTPASTCPTDIEWKSKPSLRYPDGFERRSIDGWAVISFDVAPWGAVGNPKVVAAEPATELGDAALYIVAGGTVAKPEQGYSGCLEMVRYVMRMNESREDAPVN